MRTSRLVILIVLLLLAATVVGCGGRATTPSPTPMQSSEVWTTYSNASFVISLACDGSNLWVTTGGGIVLAHSK